MENVIFETPWAYNLTLVGGEDGIQLTEGGANSFCYLVRLEAIESWMLYSLIRLNPAQDQRKKKSR